MTLSIQSQIVLAALRAAGRAIYARDLERTLPGRRRRGVAAILGSLAARRLAVVLPGSPHRYEAASPRGEQGRIAGLTDARTPRTRFRPNHITKGR